MSDNYKVEKSHEDNKCGGPTKCSSCAIRFAKIFGASAGITLAKDIKPNDTLVVGFSGRLSMQQGHEATERLSYLLGCKVVVIPECDTLAVMHAEEGEDEHH